MSAAQDDDTRDGVWEPRFAPVAQIIPPNVFADMDVKVAAAVASGADVIDLAKGNPDAYPAEFIRDVAKSSVDDPLNARYTPFDGKPAFLQAAANWYRNVHGVELDWRSQLFAVEGAVDGLADHPHLGERHSRERRRGHRGALLAAGGERGRGEVELDLDDRPVAGRPVVGR